MPAPIERFDSSQDPQCLVLCPGTLGLAQGTHAPLSVRYTRTQVARIRDTRKKPLAVRSGSESYHASRCLSCSSYVLFSGSLTLYSFQGVDLVLFEKFKACLKLAQTGLETSELDHTIKLYY